MTDEISKNHPNYQHYVVENDERNYEILTSKAEEDSKIRCPYDDDMFVEKTSTGAIKIHKLSYTSKIFHE